MKMSRKRCFTAKLRQATWSLSKTTSDIAFLLSKKDNSPFLSTTSQRNNSSHKMVTRYFDVGFGELALLYNTKRTSSVKALETSNLWVIDRQTFREAVE